MPNVVQSEYRQIEETLRKHPNSTSRWSAHTRAGLKDPSKWVWSDTCFFLNISEIDNIKNLAAIRRAIKAIKQKKFVAGQEHKLYSLQNREKVLTSEIKRATLDTSTDEGASTRTTAVYADIDYSRLQDMYRRGAGRRVTPIFTEVTNLPDDFF